MLHACAALVKISIVHVACMRRTCKNFGCSCCMHAPHFLEKFSCCMHAPNGKKKEEGSLLLLLAIHQTFARPVNLTRNGVPFLAQPTHAEHDLSRQHDKSISLKTALKILQTFARPADLTRNGVPFPAQPTHAEHDLSSQHDKSFSLNTAVTILQTFARPADLTRNGVPFPAQPTHAELDLSSQHDKSFSLKDESQQIAVWQLLYQVRHLDRYISRLQTIWDQNSDN